MNIIELNRSEISSVLGGYSAIEIGQIIGGGVAVFVVVQRSYNAKDRVSKFSICARGGAIFLTTWIVDVWAPSFYKSITGSR